jgi:flagellar biosynthesis/type III secretory pathway chaperone
VKNFPIHSPCGSLSDELFKITAYGHLVCVLVDVDLAKQLRYKILAERKGFAFFVEVNYENIPYLNNHCQCIGHNIESCRRIKAPDHNKLLLKLRTVSTRLPGLMNQF